MAKENKSATQGPVKFSSAYWGTQIQDAINRHETTFWKEAEESIHVYNTRRKLENVQRRVNVWWYIVNTLMPAYYSSTPKAECNLRKQAGSQIMDLSAVLLERNVQFSMDMDFDFDFVGMNSALNLLLTGRGVLWARKEVEFGESQVIPMVVRPEGIYLPDGTPYQGPLEELEETKEGLILTLDTIESEKAILESVHIRDYINSDARNEEEIEWRARRAYLCREEVEEKFGKDMVKNLSFNSFPDTSREDRKIRTDDRNSREGKAEIWEVWSEEQDKVLWVQAKGKKSIVESDDVPIEYPGFYPCSVVNISLDPDSTIPTSDYSHAKDQILEVERLAERKHAMIQAVRPNAFYDATMGDDLQSIFTGDLKLLPLKNWPSHKGRGGMPNMVEYLNIAPYVEALGVISQELEQAKQSLFQMLKVSDLLQGVSDPRKTATANRLENAWSSLGLIVRQNEFANFIGEGIEKLGTVVATFDNQRLLDNGDAQSLLAPLVTQEMPYEMLAEAVIAPLKNTRELFKLQIASDSMVALDERQERQDTADLLNSASGYFDQMKGFVEQYPSMAPFAIRLFEKMMRSYKGGKELEALYTKTLQDVASDAQRKMEQAAQQPPDPKVMEIQGRMQIAQMESEAKLQTFQIENQTKLQLAQADMQREHEKNMVEMQRVASQTQLEQWKVQNEIAIKQQELALKGKEIEIQILKIQSESGYKGAELNLKEQEAALNGVIEQQKLQLEEAYKNLAIKEKLLEEARLGKEASIQEANLVLKAREVSAKEKQANKKPKTNDK